MVIKFDIMEQDDLMAHVEVDTVKKSFKVENKVFDIWRNPVLSLDTYDYFLYFIDSRRFPMGRPERGKLFSDTSINGDRWAEIRETRGTDYDDHVWFKFPGDNVKWGS